MSKVNVRLLEIFAVPGSALVSVTTEKIASASVVVSNNAVLPGTISKRVDLAGYAQFDLVTGRYKVTAKSAYGKAQAFEVLIDVPNDAATYELTQLIVSGAGAFSQPITSSPNATADILGLVRTNTTSATPIVYLKSEVDALDSQAPRRRPRGGLRCSTLNTPHATGTGAGPALGLNDLTLEFEGSMDDWLQASANILFWSHGSGNNSLRLNRGVSGGNLVFPVIFLDGAGAATQYNFQPASALTNGRRHHIAITLDRDGNGQLYVDGNASGAPISVAGTSAIDIGNGNAGSVAILNALGGIAHALRIHTRVLSAAEILEMARVGRPPWGDTYGSLGSKYTSNFSAGADGWTVVGGGSLTGNTDGIGGQNDWLLCDSGATTDIAALKTLGLARAQGQRIKVAITVYRPSTNVTGVCLLLRNQTPANNGFTLRTPAADTVVTYIEEVLVTEATTGIALQLRTAGGASATVTAGDKFYFKAAIVEYPGCVFDPNFDDADPEVSTRIGDRAYEAQNLTAISVALQVMRNRQLNALQAHCKAVIGNPLALTYAATVDLNFASSVADMRTLALTGNVTFTTSNRQTGRTLDIKILADGSARNFTFPGTWKWIGAGAPASIAASKTAILRLRSWGTTDADVTARYEVEL